MPVALAVRQMLAALDGKARLSLTLPPILREVMCQLSPAPKWLANLET